VRILILLFTLSIISQNASAVKYICGPSSTGSGTGADFNNRMQLPDTTGFERGSDYVVIEGNYGNRNFEEPVSGTSFVTIRAVDPAQDSAIAGYSTALFDTYAEFNLFVVNKPRLILNGVRRDEITNLDEPTGYGIRISDQLKASSINGDDASFSQFSYLDIGGPWSTNPGGAVCSYGNAAIYFVFDQHDITFTRCVFHNSGHNGGLAMVHGSEDFTFDHCDFYFGWGKSSVATPNAGQQRHTLAFCRFWNAAQLDTCPDVEGGGLTAEVGTYSWVGTTDGNLVYGCIFYSTASGGRNSSIQYGEASPGPTATNCKVINNTFAGFVEDSTVAEIYLYAGSGNEAKNNLFWDTAGTMTITANTVANNVDAVSNPFVDYANRDFRLASAVAGASVASPYSTDYSGNTRGSDGVTDVGAFEYDSGGGGTSGGGSGDQRVTINGNVTFNGNITK
jgi:hypothetical protein